MTSEAPSSAGDSPEAPPAQTTAASTDTAWTHLEVQRAERRRRRRRNLITLGVIVVCMGVGVVIALQVAGRMGVPGFGYTNEFGSSCRNQLVGHTCSPVTLIELNGEAGTDFPASTELRRSSSTVADESRVEAVLGVPAADADAVTEMLEERFGECSSFDPPEQIEEFPPGPWAHTCQSNSGLVRSSDDGSGLHQVLIATREDDSLDISLAVWGN